MMNTSFIHLPVLACSLPHTFTVLRTCTQQMINKLKSAGQSYKEMLPKYVGIKAKYDDVKRREDQAAEQVERQKQRVAFLENKVEEYRKVCNKAKLSFTFTH